MKIQLESCLSMSRTDAERIRDAKYPGGVVRLSFCECHLMCGGDDQGPHWYHPPWVIEIPSELQED